MALIRLCLLACLHDQNKSRFFGGPAFIQVNQSKLKSFLKALIAGKKPALQKSRFCFNHVNRLYNYYIKVLFSLLIHFMF